MGVGMTSRQKEQGEQGIRVKLVISSLRLPPPPRKRVNFTGCCKLDPGTLNDTAEKPDRICKRQHHAVDQLLRANHGEVWLVTRIVIVRGQLHLPGCHEGCIVPRVVEISHGFLTGSGLAGLGDGSSIFGALLL